ncbi:WalW protein [Tamilnaduibacter salinus]|uniref:WalW protein n=1 Tax=Tamilnaduibacter salinus TaxID=1484056 RepID=A0A2A2I6P1_9GAMM|nr:polysaccharide deacetylase family protein [Tamilnaduibacter salinus]PAV27048.1 WalW protein [Tamilnaduibacter salinus]
MFQNRRYIQPSADMTPRLMVVVDTEEEFDWHGEPDPEATQVSAMAHIERVQSIFDDYGIQPCYVIDYPIASQSLSIDALRSIYEQGRCEIGAHLHPWVNPPVEEALTKPNTYPGNLPRALEHEKLQHLRDTIQDAFGAPPTIYKAGRYGFGPNTTEILQELGFRTDLSVCPPLDSRGDGGPDYRRYDARPFWFGTARELLELPVTGAFTGWAHRFAVPLFDLATRLRRFRAPGILARLGAVDRLMLSPEGFSSDEHIRLTRFLMAQGVRTFTWSFHSPSVVPGHTDYVQTEQDLDRFLASFRRYFDFFFNELGGEATTPSRLRTHLESIT